MTRYFALKCPPFAAIFGQIVLACALVTSISAAETQSSEAQKWEADSRGFETVVAPFFEQHCVACHGESSPEAELNLSTGIPNDFLDLSAKGHWGEVVNVLNSHEMPPETEAQPAPEEVAKVVDWITQQMSRAELMRRDSAIVLRRLNREEYQNTISDLTTVDFDISGFPMDPAAGGFDNNGAALTLSPLHMELYVDAARKILDEALVQGDKPPVINWRIQFESGSSDSNRVTYDGQRLIVNGGNNPVEGDYKILHHTNWDKNLNTRDFALKNEGEYILRIRAAGKVPTREQVIASAEKILRNRMEEQIQKNPKGEKWHREQYERDLEHFKTDRMYDYGPPRLKLVQTLGGQPRVIAEFDVPTTLDDPGVYEVRTRFTTEKAGVTIEYGYSLPRELENFWFQSHDSFARPELWVDWLEIEGPVFDSWPPPGHKQILGNIAGNKRPNRADAKKILAEFMPKAYRRPVTSDEVSRKLELFDQVAPTSETLIDAIKTPLIAVLVSPEFLYLSEPSSASASDGTHTPRTLNDYELASRLSYFLWSTMPDDQLLELAHRKTLRDPQELTDQVNRMLADPRSSEFIQNFAGQWLSLREVGANPPAPDLYPRYDRHLEVSIVREAEEFFREILQNDLSALNLVKSDFVVINERLGRYYGIPGVRGDQFRRVPVPEGVARGGIVTQASMLTITSNGTRTSPVKRGTWVLKNVLGIDPGLPVANAGDIAPKVPGIDKATVRQRLEIHRELPQCARCHNKIDPLGFALENFNAAGEFREKEGFGYKGRIGDNDPLIDASAKLPDGTEFVGVTGLQDALMAQQDLFLTCLARKMFTYAIGRELVIADEPVIKEAVEHMHQNDETPRSLVQFIVHSELFQSK